MKSVARQSAIPCTDGEISVTRDPRTFPLLRVKLNLFMYSDFVRVVDYEHVRGNEEKLRAHSHFFRRFPHLGKSLFTFAPHFESFASRFVFRFLIFSSREMQRLWHESVVN